MAVSNEFRELTASLSDKYYKLVLIVGSSGSGKTSFVNSVCNDIGYGSLNLNLVLSKELKEIPIMDRKYYVQDHIDRIIGDNPNDILVIDNIELLFSRHLLLDPLRILKNISRYRKIIATWPGSIDGDYLTYANPHHDDYVCYSLKELECLYIDLERGMQGEIRGSYTI